MNLSKLGEIVFEVTPYTAGGVPGTSGSTTATITPDTTKPAPVNWFLCNVQDMSIALSWEPPKELDIGSYEVRYSPNITDANWNASQQIGLFAHNVTRTMVGARTGTYMICVRDTSGNLSDMYYRRTTIEELPHINLIHSVNDYPGWNGTLGGVTLFNGKVQSSGEFGSVSPEGFYYFDSIFDAGQVYELRIVSKIKSHGSMKNDYMINWVPLSIAKPLVGASASRYNAMLEVRTANNIQFMVDWVPLGGVSPIAGGGDDIWSPWRPCEVGDFTGRLFQFRVRLQSFDPFVKAVLDDGLVEIDVKERIDRYSDLAVPDGGLDVVFDPPFIDVPTLAVTTDNSVASSKIISNKTRLGFTVQLFHHTGEPVEGHVDVLALGYGRERPKSI